MAEHTDVPPQLLEAIDNLSRFHREHEKFYYHPAPNPMAGAEDLNPPGLVGESGILFMEGEGEPAEIAQLKREIEEKAAGCERPASGSPTRWSRLGRSPGRSSSTRT